MQLSAPGTYLLVYDDTCGLCARSVRFVLKRDRARRYRFCPNQSPLGRRLCEEVGLSIEAPESLVAIVAGKRFLKGEAVLRIALSFGGVWTLLSPCLLLPRRLLDYVYDAVARRRKALCPLPPFRPEDAELKSRTILTL